MHCKDTPAAFAANAAQTESCFRVLRLPVSYTHSWFMCKRSAVFAKCWFQVDMVVGKPVECMVWGDGVCTKGGDGV